MTDPQVRQLAEQDEKLFADWAEKQYPGMSYDSTEEVAIRYAHYFASHTRREALSQLVEDLEDCGSLACTLLDIPLERVEFGPEGMRMDCETAKTLAGAAIARIRNWVAIRLLAEEKK